MQKECVFETAAKRKYPEPVILVIVRDRKGKYNPMPCSWAMQSSRDPLMFTFSLSHKRYSLEAIRRKGEFVISFPSVYMAEEVLFYGTNSGRDTDKFTVKPLETRKAGIVDSVIIEKSVANFECTLESEHIAGDHILITAKVVKAWENDDESLRRLYNTGSGYVLAGVNKDKSPDIF